MFIMDKAHSKCITMMIGKCVNNFDESMILLRILYFSIHRYDNGRYWPHLRESNFDRIGDARGKGYNVNIPLNEVGKLF